MNDHTQNAQNAQNEPAIAPAATATPAPAPDLSALKRAIFTPAQAEAAAAAVEKARSIAAAHNLPEAFNWDAANDALPDGYGIAIIPVKQVDKSIGQSVTTSLYIAGVPSPEAVLAAVDAKGADWIESTIYTALVNKFANAVRPREGQNAPLSVPFSVSDFITSATRDSGLTFFREHGGDYVKALKDKGLSIMNMTLLRQILSSAEFASQQFPTVTNDKWDGLLDKMIAHAARVAEDAGMLAVWKETRAVTKLATGDFDLDDIDL